MISVYTDGASKGNPGPGWAMWIIEYKDNIVKNRLKLEKCTNNEAEYLAVIHALKQLIKQKKLFIKEIKIVFNIDSLLVVKQLNGEYKIKDMRMKKFVHEIRFLLKVLNFKVDFNYIPREKNKADKLKFD